jgi:hypothetical protein
MRIAAIQYLITIPRPGKAQIPIPSLRNAAGVLYQVSNTLLNREAVPTLPAER